MLEGVATFIGGLSSMESINRQKAELLYQAIDQSDGFYAGHAQPDCRSLMNVTFNLPDHDLLKRFIAGGWDIRGKNCNSCRRKG